MTGKIMVVVILVIHLTSGMLVDTVSRQLVCWMKYLKRTGS